MSSSLCKKFKNSNFLGTQRIHLHSSELLRKPTSCNLHLDTKGTSCKHGNLINRHDHTKGEKQSTNGATRVTQTKTMFSNKLRTSVCNPTGCSTLHALQELTVTTTWLQIDTTETLLREDTLENRKDMEPSIPCFVLHLFFNCCSSDLLVFRCF